MALRRTEALCRLFRGIPGKEDGEAPRASARALRRRLSILRSEEVGRALLRDRPDAPPAPLHALVFPEELPAVRVDADEVASVERSLARWRHRLATERGGAFAPRADAETVLLRRTRRRFRRLLRRLAELLPPESRTLHAARIAAKRVRYALELLEPLDPGARPLLRLLRSFQDAAGRSHDFAELAATVRSAAAADAAGRHALESLARRLDADAAGALERARRDGLALAGPVGRLRRSLRAAETR